MTEDRYVFLFLLFHLLSCIVLLLLSRIGFLRIPRRFIVLAFFLPVWGGVMALVAERYARKKKMGRKAEELAEIEERTSSPFFHPLFLKEEDAPSVVPLEEAMVLEEPATRRNLMLSLIQEDPKQYLPLLKKIRMEDDPEVSHYASTAIMQIQREYELDLQKKEQDLEESPEDEAAIQAYAEKLKEYIQIGLLADNALIAQRRKLNMLFVKILSDSDGNRELYLDAIENLIELKEYNAAEAMLKEIDKRWAYDEAFFLLKLKLYHKIRNGWAMKNEIQRINESGIYLTPKTRKIVEFWSGQSDG